MNKALGLELISFGYIGLISLYNTFYKIIPKIMINRILDCVIQPTQNASVPQTVIHDNIFVAHDTMNKFRWIKGRKEFVVKIDMETPCHKLEYEFLFHYLHSMGFHPAWIT